MKQRQDELLAIYREHLSELVPLVKPKLDQGRDLSLPFLIDLTAHSYAESKIRLMVVGQQTNGWARNWDQDLDEMLGDSLQCYREFDLGAGVKRAFRTLHQQLNPNGNNDGFMWNNLVKVDEGNRRPQADVEERLARHFNVLPAEIEVAQPDVVVFFTGATNYDFRLCSTLRGVEFRRDATIPDFLSELRPTGASAARCFRTEHPGALRR